MMWYVMQCIIALKLILGLRDNVDKPEAISRWWFDHFILNTDRRMTFENFNGRHKASETVQP